MITIIFTQDFATKKAGDIWTCDGMLAAQLTGVDKVAKVYNKQESPAEPEVQPVKQEHKPEAVVDSKAKGKKK